MDDSSNRNNMNVIDNSSKANNKPLNDPTNLVCPHCEIEIDYSNKNIQLAKSVRCGHIFHEKCIIDIVSSKTPAGRRQLIACNLCTIVIVEYQLITIINDPVTIAKITDLEKEINELRDQNQTLRKEIDERNQESGLVDQLYEEIETLEKQIEELLKDDVLDTNYFHLTPTQMPNHLKIEPHPEYFNNIRNFSKKVKLTCGEFTGYLPIDLDTLDEILIRKDIPIDRTIPPLPFQPFQSFDFITRFLGIDTRDNKFLNLYFLQRFWIIGGSYTFQLIKQLIFKDKNALSHAGASEHTGPYMTTKKLFQNMIGLKKIPPFIFFSTSDQDYERVEKEDIKRDIKLLMHRFKQNKVKTVFIAPPFLLPGYRSNDKRREIREFLETISSEKEYEPLELIYLKNFEELFDRIPPYKIVPVKNMVIPHYRIIYEGLLHLILTFDERNKINLILKLKI